MTDIAAFLLDAGLSELDELFRAEDINLDIIADLSDQELRDLGLTLGQRKRLSKAIAGLSGAAPAPSPAADAQAGSDPEAERRRVTAVFIDLVGSTNLARTLEVEQYHDILSAYQTVCTEAVERHGGTVAKYMGDGILVYFGYPKAAENAAQGSLRASLEAIAAVASLRPLPDTRLSVRIGVATGLAVIGDLLGRGIAAERQIVGETPNLAARLQAVAAPDTVVISDATYDLVRGYFEVEALAPQNLAGFPDPQVCYRVLSELEIDDRFDARRGNRLLARLQGRDAEIDRLMALWRSASQGKGRAAQVVAEPGMGKSRILSELQDRVAGEAGATLHLTCDAGFSGTALFPIASFLRRQAGIDRNDAAKTAFAKISAMVAENLPDDPDLRPVFAWIAGIPAAGLYTPPAEDQQQLGVLARALRDLVLGRAGGRPAMVFFEDLHWADSTTREFFAAFAACLEDAPILLVGTSRPEGALPDSAAMETWTYGPLEPGAVEALINDVCGGLHLPGDVVSQILERSGGNPLYAEEISQALLESGRLQPSGKRLIPKGPLQDVGVPSSLHDTLMSRLDRLPTGREFASIAAVVGRDFDAETVAHLCGRPLAQVEEALEHLSTAGIVFPQAESDPGHFLFKHALLQDAAYESLLVRRRGELHRHMAELIERRSGDAGGPPPELMAHHLSRAGDFGRAVEFGLQAGFAALTRSANAEAIQHSESCLTWLKNLEEGETRSKTELAVLSMLAPALMASRGFAADELQAATARAQKLLDELGDSPDAFPTLYGLTIYHHSRGERQAARQMADRFLMLAERIQDRDNTVIGLAALGQAKWLDGDFEGALEAMDAVVRFYDLERHRGIAVQYGIDPLGFALCAQSHIAWMKGQEDLAIELADRAVDHTGELGHAMSHGIAMVFRNNIHAERGDREKVRQLGPETMDYLTRMGVATAMSYATMVINWANGDLAGSEQLFDLHDTMGAHVGMTFYRSLAMETALEAGDLAAARRLMDRNMQQLAQGEAFWEPELHRLAAHLNAAEGGDPDDSRSALIASVQTARAMGAYVFEARSLIEVMEAFPETATPEARARLDTLLREKSVRLPMGLTLSGSPLQSFAEGFAT